MKLFQLERYFDKSVNIQDIRNISDIELLPRNKALALAAWIVSQHNDPDLYYRFAKWVAANRSNDKLVMNRIYEDLMNCGVHCMGFTGSLNDYNFPETLIDLDSLTPKLKEDEPYRFIFIFLVFIVFG